MGHRCLCHTERLCVCGCTLVSVHDRGVCVCVCERAHTLVKAWHCCGCAQLGDVCVLEGPHVCPQL